MNYSERIDQLFQQAYGAAERGDEFGARGILQQILALDPNYVEALVLLGYISPPTEARDAFERALQLNPYHAQAQRGLLELEANQQERAMGTLFLALPVVITIMGLIALLGFLLINDDNPEIEPTVTIIAVANTSTATTTITLTLTAEASPTPTETLAVPTVFLSPTPLIRLINTPRQFVPPTPSVAPSLTIVAQDFTPTPTNLPSETPTNTATATEDPNQTWTPTPTATETDSGTPTATNTVTMTPSPTNTPDGSPTVTPEFPPTATNTPTATSTLDVTPTNTITLTPSATFTPTETLLATATATLSPTHTESPTTTPTPSATNTLDPAVTATATFTATETVTATATATSTETATSTATATATFTATPTNTPTFTPTSTATATATFTATFAPTFTPTSTLTPTISVVTFDESGAMASLINQERCAQGLPPIVVSGALNSAATTHSIDMALNDFVGQTGTDGSSPTTRMANAGYGPIVLAGENVRGGPNTAGAVFAQWLASESGNILNPDLREIGVGHAMLEGTTFVHYWTLDMASRGTDAGTCP